MEPITIKANIWKTGSSNVVTIPNRYILDGIIDKDKPLTIILQEQN